VDGTYSPATAGAKEEGTREGLVSNAGFLCLNWGFPTCFYSLVWIVVSRCLDGNRVHPSLLCVPVKRRTLGSITGTLGSTAFL
jgi:hypothetical protein